MCPQISPPPRQPPRHPISSFYSPPAEKHLPARRTFPHPQISPPPSERPSPFFIICPPDCPPAKKHLPARCPSPPPQKKLPCPFQRLLSGPVASFFLFPANRPPSGKTPPRLTGPPRTPELSHPSHYLLPNPVASLFLCLANRSQQKTIAPPHTSKLPRHPNKRPGNLCKFI